MQLDPITLMLVAALTGLFLPIVLMGIRHPGERDPAVGVWTRAVFIYAGGFVCLMLRTVIPDALSLALGNTLLLLGYAELCQGFRLYFQRSPNRSLQWIVIPLYFVLFLIFLDRQASFEARVVLASIFLSGASAAIAREFLDSTDSEGSTAIEIQKSDRRLEIAFAVIFALSSLVLLVRGVIYAAAIFNRDGEGPGMASFSYALSYLVAACINVLLAAGLPILLSRRTHRRLATSEASLLRVQQVGRVAFSLLDTSAGTIVVNEVLREMLGLPADLEITLEIWKSMVHSEDVAGVIQAASAAKLGEHQSDGKEYRVIHFTDKRMIWVAISSQMQRDPVSGKLLLLSILRDITSIKTSELAAIHAKEDADKANQFKGQFLANMSHEIRTPMNAILGLLNLLQSTELTHRQRDYASKTEGAAQSLLGLLNDILDFSKVEAGKLTLESEPFRLDKLMRNLSVILSANVGSKDIEVLFDIDSTLPAMVRGDAMRLQQVLVNLGGNAIKFTSHGQVVMAMCKLAETENTVNIKFSVQDSGIGIAPEHQEHIFSGFSQAEGSTTRRFGGSGLGLAISKRFVELMGGDIRIDSKQGIGSTFAFTLELSTADAATETQTEPLANPKQSPAMPRRVLVVDDNPIAGNLTLRMVRSWGWTADLAKSGKDAIEHISAQFATGPAEFPYPVIYMDWIMPGMDGWETTRQIRELALRSNLSQPTVIMITAHGRETLSQRTEEEQAMINGFLVKPMTASMLFDTLMEAQSGKAGFRELTKGRSNNRQLKGMRILIVEDNLINQQVADELLSAEGALVSLAANGQLGVDAVAAAAPQFDVVLMDIQMPVLDGYGATRAIREDLHLRDLPIIAMTANAMASDRDACIAAGMNEHVGKPFEMAKLVSLLIRTTGLHADSAPSDTAGASHTSPTLPKAVPEVAGLDIQTALNRMSGMRSLYLRTAKEFVKFMDTAIPELQQCLSAGDNQEATMRLHSLKGNAGTLGATELAIQAAILEKLCNTVEGMQECKAGLSQFELVVRATQVKMREAITLLGPEPVTTKSTTGGENSGPVNDADLEALKGIAALARASDMSVLQAFAEARELMEQLPAESVAALDSALQSLDLDTVATVCDQMLLSVSDRG